MSTHAAAKVIKEALDQGHNPSLADISALLVETEQAVRDAAKASAARPRRRGHKAGESEQPQESTTMTTSQSATPTTGTTNSLTFDEMLKVASDLGVQAGAGVDVQIRFDMKVLEAAYLGVIDLQKDKYGPGVDDATKLGESYAKGRNSQVIFDAKEPKQQKLISNIRTSMKLGGWTKGGTGEPLSTVNSLMSLRQTLRKDPQHVKRLDDAHNTFMRFAREQVKRDSVIPQGELRGFCFKADSQPQTEEQFLEGLRKKVNKAKEGKADFLMDEDTAKKIAAACTSRLTAIAKAKNPQAAAPKAAA